MTKDKNKKLLQAPSDHFEDAFRDGHGTTNADCELCGRHIFCSGDMSLGYEEGELEVLRAKAKAYPEKYDEWHDVDGVSLGHIGGKQFVLGCSCNALRKYEDFILSHMRQITRYLKEVRSQKVEELKQEVQELQDL